MRILRLPGWARSAWSSPVSSLKASLFEVKERRAATSCCPQIRHDPVKELAMKITQPFTFAAVGDIIIRRAFADGEAGLSGAHQSDAGSGHDLRQHGRADRRPGQLQRAALPGLPRAQDGRRRSQTDGRPHDDDRQQPHAGLWRGGDVRNSPAARGGRHPPRRIGKEPCRGPNGPHGGDAQRDGGGHRPVCD